jgi:hypothetical protein
MGVLRLKLENVCASKNYRHAVFSKGQLFFTVWEIKENNVYLAVFHVALDKDAGVYILF